MKSNRLITSTAILGIMCLALLIVVSVCSAEQMTVFPEEGKAAAVCSVAEEGRWLVVADGFLPVSARTHKLADGGSVVMWQGDPGDKFGAIFIPHDQDKQLQSQAVKLTGVKPPVQPPTQPPTTPPGTDLSAIAAQLKAAAEAATSDPSRAKTAQDLAALAGFISGQIRSGALTNYQGIAMTVDKMFDLVTTHTAWSPTKSLIGKHLVALAQQGATAETYAAYFDDVQAGLLASVPQAMQEARPDRVNMELLMMFFKFFIEYILPLLLAGIGG
jgi:hypothetical protein